MCYSMQILFTWPIPIVPLTLLCFCALLPYVYSRNPESPLHLNNLSKMSVQNIWLFVLLAVNIVYHQLYTVSPITFLGFLVPTVMIFFTFCFSITPADFIKRCYHSFDTLLKVICCISLFGWLLFLLGVPLPHFETETNNYYDHDVYYLFIFNIKEFDFLPRFAGMFLEPGHIGSTCCMMLFINRFRMKDWSNWIYVVSILLSLSLAAYCLLGIGAILFNIFAGKQVTQKLLLIAALIFGVYIFGTTVNDGDNEINNLILSRLEIVDGNLAGNNRTDPLFDQHFKLWMQKGEVFMGYGPERLAKNTNVLLGTAGIQRFFFLHGIFGFILVFALYAMLYWRSRSKLGLGFALLYLINNIIRDYPYREMWLYLFIMAMYILAENGEGGNDGAMTENAPSGQELSSAGRTVVLPAEESRGQNENGDLVAGAAALACAGNHKNECV